MAYDQTEVVRLTGFSDDNRHSLARYYARLSETARMEVHRLQTERIRRSRNKKGPGKEAEFFYAQFLLSLHDIHQSTTGKAMRRKKRLTEEEIENIARVRKMLIGESRQKPAPIKNLIDERFYGLIGEFRENGVSWRDISKYIGKYHKRKISHTHLKRCFEQISAERMNREL